MKNADIIRRLKGIDNLRARLSEVSERKSHYSEVVQDIKDDLRLLKTVTHVHRGVPLNVFVFQGEEYLCSEDNDYYRIERPGFIVKTVGDGPWRVASGHQHNVYGLRWRLHLDTQRYFPHGAWTKKITEPVYKDREVAIKAAMNWAVTGKIPKTMFLHTVPSDKKKRKAKRKK